MPEGVVNNHELEVPGDVWAAAGCGACRMPRRVPTAVCITTSARVCVQESEARSIKLTEALRAAEAKAAALAAQAARSKAAADESSTAAATTKVSHMYPSLQ